MWTFHPILKTTIWGGERIAPYTGIPCNQHSIGEAWLISGVEGSETTVDAGPDAGLTVTGLVKRYGAELLGPANHERFGNEFPLLIKIIDAADDLSVQVHPDDRLARGRGQKNGKTEMWYVIGADKGAALANGFKRPVAPADYQRLVDTGEITDWLNFNTIHAGEAYFIPAGRVHAIGKGAFVAEIQQTSDVTYRLYDYHRRDADGKERELHTAEAFDAINFSDCDVKAVDYTPLRDLPVTLVDCPYFTTDVLELDNAIIRDYSDIDSFVILIGIEGKATVTHDGEEVRLSPGKAVLIPASQPDVAIHPQGKVKLLETFIK